MKKVILVVAVVLAAWLGHHHRRTGRWPWQLGPSARPPVDRAAMDDLPAASAAGREPSGSAPLTEAGTLVEIHGMLHGSQVTPRLEGAAEKAQDVVERVERSRRQELGDAASEP
jgi:hypothetical protein